MKQFKTIILCILACVLCLGVGEIPARALDGFVPPSETNPFVSNYYIGATDQKSPFFDVILPAIAENIEEYNTHSISPYYDKFPEANNPENFQGLGSTTYANINGKTVTAEAFYRVKGDSLNDPNNGMGLLIYQCIQYKRAHPDEDVKITYSSYRTSATASVCVLPESKYYGYMRSLYGTNYDEHGFVRISYMLVEAARMGIEVTMVNQLPSYGVSQYDPAQNKTRSRSAINFETYFNRALKTDCYDSYVSGGKKVSDFLNFVVVDWTVTEKTSDMQHVKSATASHYLATDGTEHTSAVFVSSSNLDENNYQGCNGNGSSQSGAIISDHDELYRVTYNYMQLMARYPGQEEMFELRQVVNQMNEEQAALIMAGRGDEIPADEQIIYLGTENDPVFEMYFTPFGGSADAWETELNPFCKYVDKFHASTGYVEFIWNEFGYGVGLIGRTMERMLEDVYVNRPSLDNKLAIRVYDFNTTEIRKLTPGSQIGYLDVRSGANIHSKDILMSYEEEGVRHNVSLMTSCNFYTIAFSYRTNSLLVINETEESGGNFYEIQAKKYSYNMINTDFMANPAYLVLEPGESYPLDLTYEGSDVTWSTSKKAVAKVSNGVVTAVGTGSATITVKGGGNSDKVYVTVVECRECADSQGLKCSRHEQYLLSEKFDELPLTFEATFSVKPEDLTGTATLLGSDGSFDPALVFSLNKSGQPRVMFRTQGGYTSQGTYVFKEVNVATGEEVHLSIVIDKAAKQMHCYVNGVLKQTISKVITLNDYEQKHHYAIGGDQISGNGTCFPGLITSVAIWSDVRTAEEIKSDYTNGITTTDTALMAAYNLKRCAKHLTADLSGNGVELERVVLWQSKDDVEPVGEYDYSFAVIGDTQTMCEKDPDAMEAIYDWILANQEEQKIEYVIGLGDITDDSTDQEWVDALEAINKLNGEIPYVLTRGNHDDWDDFNRNLHNGFYETTVDGMMVSGPVELTDPSQPGLIPGILPDGSSGLVTREEDVPEGGTVQGDLTNSYRYFNVQGVDYLFMTLDFAPNSKVLEWANGVIEAHPDHRVVIITHAYMYRDGTTLDAGDCYPPTYYTGYTDAQNGDDIWYELASQHKNVLMVLSGHDPWQHIVYRQDRGVYGNTVTQMLIDAQYVDLYSGSNGMVAMFYFSNNGDTLTVRFYSVERDCYGSEASQFTVELR